MSENRPVIYEFGAFRLDPRERLLLRDDDPVRVQPKAFETLVMLVKNSGHLVRKDELIGTVWADAFVEENNLTKNIHALRQALNGDGEQFIETVPRQGYRFTAPVRQVAIEKTTSVRLVLKEEITETTKSRTRLFGALALLAILLVAVGFIVSRTNSASARSAMLGATSAEAFEDYKQARALWQTRKAADLHEATLLLEKAVELDPGFARAHAALGDAYAFSYTNWKKAEDEANYALKLDPTLGEAHATIGFVRMFWEWKLVTADEEFRRAVALAPEYATAHHWYALNLLARADGDAGLVEMRKALELEPASAAINADLCQALFFHHLFGEAEAQCRAAIAMDASFINAHVYLYDVLTAQQRYGEAVNEYLEIERVAGKSVTSTAPDVEQKLRAAYDKNGIQAFWRVLAEDYARRTPQSSYKLARIEAMLGNDAEALRRLNEAHESRDFDFVFVQVDPAFDRFHTDRTIADLKDRLMY